MYDNLYCLIYKSTFYKLKYKYTLYVSSRKILLENVSGFK